MDCYSNNIILITIISTRTCISDHVNCVHEIAIDLIINYELKNAIDLIINYELKNAIVDYFSMRANMEYR